MKKLLMMSLMLLSFALVFTACSDGDDDDDSIEGTWKYITGNISVEVDASPEVFAKVLFASEKERHDDDNHTALISKGKYTVKWEEGVSKERTFTYTYTYKYGEFTLNYIDADEIVYTEKSNVTVSKNELIFKYDNTEDYGLSTIEHLFFKYKTILKNVDIDQVKVNKVITSRKYIRQ